MNNSVTVSFGCVLRCVNLIQFDAIRAIRLCVSRDISTRITFSFKMAIVYNTRSRQRDRLKRYRIRRERMRRRLVRILIMFIVQSVNTRSIWQHPRDSWWNRTAMVKLTDWPNSMFTANLRMSRGTFFWLCDELAPHIRRKNTNYRKAIPVPVRVAITLWRLASNVEYRTLGHLFGVGVSTAGAIVRQCCEVIGQQLMPKFVKFPQGQAFMDVLKGFENTWGFPHCAGAVDGSHIPIIAPSEDHTDYFNRYVLLFSI